MRDVIRRELSSLRKRSASLAKGSQRRISVVLPAYARRLDDVRQDDLPLY